jgi:hypothetical protein
MKYYLSGLSFLALVCFGGCNKADPKAENKSTTGSNQVVEQTKSESFSETQIRKKENAEEDKPASKSTESEMSAKDKTTVLAEGFGKTSDDSLKDAFRNAVRQVVGAVVDAETLVKNDQIISDKVLTYSDGFVKSYEEISKKEDKGIYHTKIKATVERRSVIAKLKASNITVKDVDGKGIFAEVITQLEAGKDARALLENALKGFPLNVMEAEVVGKPNVLEKSGSTAKVEIRVDFRVNKKAFAVFSTRLQDTLNRICKDKKEFSLRATKNLIEYNYKTASNVIHEWKPNTQTVTLVVNINTSDTGENSDWRYYVLDNECSQTLDARRRPFQAKLSLLGVDGRAIATDGFSHAALPIKRDFLALGQPVPYAAKKHGLPPCWISQFFMTPDRGESINTVRKLKFRQVDFRRSFSVTRTFTISLNELKAIESVKCELSDG